MNAWLDKLECEQNKSIQYLRRDSIEISGIPANIRHNALESKVIKIFEAAEVDVHGVGLTERDIQACHRVGNKGVTIVKYVNRKFAGEGLFCSRNLHAKKIYGKISVYINNSFGPEFGYLNSLV